MHFTFTDHPVDDVERWVGAWAAAPQPALGEPAEYGDQTLRLVVRPTVAGDRIRVRISNTFGDMPLVVGSAHIARRAMRAAVREDTDRSLTFGGSPSCVVPPSALALSDPVDLDVEAASDLAVSIYLPSPTKVTTSHSFALQTSYLARSHGDHTAAADLTDAAALTSLPFVTGVDVRATAGGTAAVVLGDSIADGAASTSDTNGRWVDTLAGRLRAHNSDESVAVLNQGIIGNRLLAASPDGRPFHGEAGLARLDRDVLAQTGVQHVIVLFGLNDIGFPGPVTPASEQVTAAELVAGYRQLIGRAHQKWVQVIGSTITPFENADSGEGFYTATKETVRTEVNHWIRTGGEFDGVIDFDAALRDPDHPKQLYPAYDSGDHLHPNDAGHRTMADAVDLHLFQPRPGSRLSG